MSKVSERRAKEHAKESEGRAQGSNCQSMKSTGRRAAIRSDWTMDMPKILYELASESSAEEDASSTSTFCNNLERKYLEQERKRLEEFFKMKNLTRAKSNCS